MSVPVSRHIDMPLIALQELETLVEDWARDLDHQEFEEIF
jgi:hypothetical protein